jgi:hypothetical protein
MGEINILALSPVKQHRAEIIFSILFMYHSIPVWFSLFKVKIGKIAKAE